MEDQRITHIIRKQLAGEELETQESALLDKWLEPDENREVYAEYQRIWNNASKLKMHAKVDPFAEWERHLSKRTVERKLNPWRLVSGIAAAVALIIVAFFALQDQTEVYTALAENAPYQVELQDGSSVWLNEGTELKVPRSFNSSNRRIELEGEAYFEVAKDTLLPFVINGIGSSVTVLGTSFNYLTSSTKSEVHLITGKLRFANDDNNAAATLFPGEWAMVDSTGNIQSGVTTNPNFLAWKDKKLVFENVAMADIIPQLEDYFDVEIKVENESILKCRIRTSFEDPILADILDELSFLLNLNYEINVDKVTLKGGACDGK